MKKILLSIGTVLSGLYTLAAIVQFIGALISNDPRTTFGMTGLAASVVPACIGGAIFGSCIGALRRMKASD